MNPPENVEAMNDEKDHDEHQDEIKSLHAIIDADQPTDSNGNNLNQQPACDKVINVQATLQSNSTLQNGKVVGRSMTHVGVVVGSCDKNSKLKLIVHDVEL